MSEELKPCPFCGGRAIMKIQKHIPNGYDYTPTCQDPSCAGRLTKKWTNEAVAIEAWNKRKSGSAEKSSTVERTAKVEEAVPNMTILKRKVDLQSILQAIKTDKIRVWLNYDGKICFRNTKTGNEISVEPYYDMEGNTNNE